MQKNKYIQVFVMAGDLYSVCRTIRLTTNMEERKGRTPSWSNYWEEIAKCCLRSLTLNCAGRTVVFACITAVP